MQLLSYLLLALFTVTSLSSAHAQSNSNIVLYQMRHANGTSEIFSVSETMASKVPDWDPGKSAPPLGIDRATKLAKDWLNGFISSIANV